MYLTENWRLKRQRYNLMGSQDTQTKEIFFPPRKVANREVKVYDLSKQETKQEEELTMGGAEGIFFHAAAKNIK